MISIFPTEEEVKEWRSVVEDVIVDEVILSCVKWVKFGECKRNAPYMEERYARTCAVEEAGLDLDKLIGIHMSMNIDHFSNTYSRSDGSCARCAKQGECEMNPSCMTETCAGFCIVKKFSL